MPLDFIKFTLYVRICIFMKLYGGDITFKNSLSEINLQYNVLVITKCYQLQTSVLSLNSVYSCLDNGGCTVLPIATAIMYRVFIAL